MQGSWGFPLLAPFYSDIIDGGDSGPWDKRDKHDMELVMTPPNLVDAASPRTMTIFVRPPGRKQK